GHARAQRPLVPPEKLRSSTDCRPTSCRRCAHPLRGDDPEPLIHQVADLPRIELIVDEYRLHRLRCPGCGATTCGTLPEGVPPGHFSPYTQAVLATLCSLPLQLGESRAPVLILRVELERLLIMLDGRLLLPRRRIGLPQAIMGVPRVGIE